MNSRFRPSFHPWIPGAALAAAVLLGAPPAGAGAPLQGSWKGAIHMPSIDLAIVVHFIGGPPPTAATIDIPLQNAHGLALTQLRAPGDSVLFQLPSPLGTASFAGTLKADSVEGTFEQGGREFPFGLRQQSDAPAPPAAAAPDTLPYRELEVRIASDTLTLAGTLSLPKSPGRHPAAVMITGSGPEDRDETIFGFKPFQLIADSLARRGIAVLRTDDRGVGGSSRGPEGATSSDFADDAVAEVRWLRGRADIDSNAVGLIGHSEGGIIALLAEGREPAVAFLVFLAGPAQRGDSILVEQGQLIGQASHWPDSTMRMQRRTQAAMFRAIRGTLPWDSVRSQVRALAKAQVDASPSRARLEHLDQILDQQTDQNIAMLRQPWFRFFIDFDPAPAIRAAKCPLLAFYGERDLQVPAGPNGRVMTRELKAGGVKGSRVRVFPEANHLFQRARSGSPQEYSMLRKEFVPGLLTEMGTWILERSGTR